MTRVVLVFPLSQVKEINWNERNCMAKDGVWSKVILFVLFFFYLMIISIALVNTFFNNHNCYLVYLLCIELLPSVTYLYSLVVHGRSNIMFYLCLLPSFFPLDMNTGISFFFNFLCYFFCFHKFDSPSFPLTSYTTHMNMFKYMCVLHSIVKWNICQHENKTLKLWKYFWVLKYLFCFLDYTNLYLYIYAFVFLW